MLDCGFCIIVKDFKAEIVEFVTLGVINAPDGTIIYKILTKYGEDFKKLSELSPDKESLVEEYDALRKALEGAGDSTSSN